MEIKEFIKDNILLFDGAMGTMLQKEGLKLGENPEILNITHPEIIKKIHKLYIEAGAKVITTNTFGANEKKLEATIYTVEEIVEKGILLAMEAKEDRDVLVALDIGPIGELLEPMGTLSFDEAYEIFKRQVILAEKYGVDIILIETMTDLYEAKAAVLAVKENSNLPVFCTMSFEESRRTFTGCKPSSMAITLEGLGVDALGINCSLGPSEILPIVKEIKEWTNIPIIVQPNAGLPSFSVGDAIYYISKEEFKNGIIEFIENGVNIVGGCCGTTPEYILEIYKAIKCINPVKSNIKSFSAVCTPSKTVKIDGVKIIGERINPTGKKLFKEALIKGDMDYILKQAIIQVDAGADILDVNVGLPEINEEETMIRVIKEIQGILDVPLQIDSSNIKAIENGLRYYNGKAIVNSVNGEDKVLDKVLPLVKKYGAAVVGLTLDEKGIPMKAEERVKIAEKILNRALEYGIKKEDVFIDTLVLTASAKQKEVIETIKSLKLISEKLGLKTVLGVSNISFGLPNREVINETFLAVALGHGLNLPILNPNSQGMIDVVNSFNVLYNFDKGSTKYIEVYGGNNRIIENLQKENDLKYIVLKGLKDEAIKATEKLLEAIDELQIVNEYLIPALDEVGNKFEKGEIFLPQLIQSAETVKNSFEVLKRKLLLENKDKISNGKIVLATVKGDIHDIGKNIVKVILENYGFEVIDLGKDVPAINIVNTVIENNITLVGLSALMTTTLKSMEETIKALRATKKDIKVFVGGAVLTKECAKMIGADFYAKDAREAVEIAKKHFGKLS
ncbi:homocysteine S-methyltransferase family protein [Clostridium chauvoei]|uniref:Methionine synthase n=2 Tax=Clostridium chauvoei TaxID=46867 RepID=A0A1U6JKH4_9CLOT|nr:homocysteine S-methyltransferase family protein [Clostridium chauvoei]ATD55633.1 homocysteine methyltransferase [Clostridium chauvoei]ATD56690.1 homocysteine methyltransferase [Clostridium chauvoei]MBX7280130.1 homocysteine S-methyltransferase family protein [Clostridium chauvoei]MBX7282614.1 homocysteine S-methyltransferase family protein [Clostridium chauvoei]MBX7285021.1 homocysteine S-methyltransferase family protein [Clostridium chauvoei]